MTKSKRSLQRKATEAESWLNEAQMTAENAIWDLDFATNRLWRFVRGEDTTITYLKECEAVLLDKAPAALRKIRNAIRTRDWADQVATGTMQEYLPNITKEEGEE